MNLDELIHAFAQHGAVGFVSLLAVFAFGMVFWLLREYQRNYDMCNDRVERLIESHIEFVQDTARNISTLTARIEHMLDRMEKVIVTAKDCVDK